MESAHVQVFYVTLLTMLYFSILAAQWADYYTILFCVTINILA